mgnify:CR=1 FL=1
MYFLSKVCHHFVVDWCCWGASHFVSNSVRKASRIRNSLSSGDVKDHWAIHSLILKFHTQVRDDFMDFHHLASRMSLFYTFYLENYSQLLPLPSTSFTFLDFFPFLQLFMHANAIFKLPIFSPRTFRRAQRTFGFHIILEFRHIFHQIFISLVSWMHACLYACLFALFTQNLLPNIMQFS